MSIKTFLTFVLISNLPILIHAQKSKFAIVLQTTTIETPPPLLNFAAYGDKGNPFGTQFRKDFSLEIIGKVYLKEHIAFRLRTGVTKYDLDQQQNDPNLFTHVKLTGKLEKYAIGIETNHFLGKRFAFRFGGDLQLGLFKDMINLNETNSSAFQATFATNSVLSLNPFWGGDWLLGHGLALSAEFRMPFERIRYREKGTTIFIRGGGGRFDFDQENMSYVGFGVPVSSIQLSYRF